MSVLFRLKTDQGYIFKLLIELLQHNIKDGCFCINQTGLYFRMSDTHHKVCIDLALLSENFILYEVNSTEDIHIGVNLIHLFKMIKSTKKGDSIELLKDNTNDLNIIHVSKIGKTTKTSIRAQSIQMLDISLSNDYTASNSIPAQEYMKLCKELENLSKVIAIRGTKTGLCFSAQLDQVYSKSIYFGKYNESEEIYNQTFNTEQLSNMKRLSGLGIVSTNIFFYCNKEQPLLLKTNVGTLGKINVYIKSRELIEAENESNRE
jgi:proliferating cell nuclear antigen